MLAFFIFAECPPGVPTAMCSDDPCSIKSCQADPKATCKANYCGGCNAVFYNKDGSKAKCIDDKKPLSVASSSPGLYLCYLAEASIFIHHIL